MVNQCIPQIEIIFTSIIAIIVMNVFMCIADYTDIKSMKIYNKFNLIFLISRVIMLPFLPFSMNFVLGGGLIFMVFLAIGMITLNPMAGDIKYGGVLGLWFGFWPAVIVVGLSLVYTLIYRAIMKLLGKSKFVVPHAPFFHLAYLSLLGYYFLMLYK